MRTVWIDKPRQNRCIPKLTALQPGYGPDLEEFTIRPGKSQGWMDRSEGGAESLRAECRRRGDDWNNSLCSVK